MSRRKLRVAAFCLSMGSAIGISGQWNLALAQHAQKEAALPVDNSELTDKSQLRRTIPEQLGRQVEFFFCETHEPSCRSNADSFSIDETRDLFVFVTLPGVRGQHLETVEFILPDGEIYQRKTTQFQIGDGGLASEPKWNGQDGEVAPPVEASHLISNANLQHESGIPALLTYSRGEATLLTALPIAGTYIAQRALTGIWQVRVLLDDQLLLATTLNLYSNAGEPNAEERKEGDRARGDGIKGYETKGEGEKGDGRARSPKS